MYFIITFCVLMLTWVVFSGQFDSFHLGLGVFSSLFLTIYSGELFFRTRSKTLGNRIRELSGFPRYFVWLLKEIVIANLYILRLALHPKCHELLEPKIVRFKTPLKTDFAKYVLANSITLTPGTVTVLIEGDEFYVHAIDQKTAESLDGTMDKRIAKVFD